MRTVLAVILSAAKDLARRTQRSFAALRMTALLSKCLNFEFGTFCPPLGVLLLQKEEMRGYLRG